MTDTPSPASPTLALALLRAREAVLTRVRPMLRSHGVTEQQWRVLRALADGPPVDTAELARRAFLLRPSLTRILRDLEARGLLERVAPPGGPRRSLLTITGRGRELIAATVAGAAAIQADIERIFGVEALGALKRDLATLERVLTRDRG